MNDRTQNRLNMIGTCLTLAQSDEHRATWENQAPTDFTADIATLATLYAAARLTAQRIQMPITGVAVSKQDAETAIENCDIALIAALRPHFRKTGDMENLAKVNFSDSGIRELRDQDLLNVSKIIRDCGTFALTHADAGKRGVTAEKVAALTAAIGDFDTLLNAPRAKITDRSALVRELVTQVAACMSQVEGMDDFASQFAGTPAGDHFAAAWEQARIIVDAGHGPGEEEEPPAGGNPPTP